MLCVNSSKGLGYNSEQDSYVLPTVMSELTGSMGGIGAQSGRVSPWCACLSALQWQRLSGQTQYLQQSRELQWEVEYYNGSSRNRCILGRIETRKWVRKCSQSAINESCRTHQHSVAFSTSFHENQT